MIVNQVAMTVLNDLPDTPLSPFFARANWVAVFDLDSGRRVLVRNSAYSADLIIEQICRVVPQHAICGHVDKSSAQRILEAGIDLRLGPCSVPASALLRSAHQLPQAHSALAFE